MKFKDQCVETFHEKTYHIVELIQELQDSNFRPIFCKMSVEILGFVEIQTLSRKSSQKCIDAVCNKSVFEFIYSLLSLSGTKEGKILKFSLKIFRKLGFSELQQ